MNQDYSQGGVNQVYSQGGVNQDYSQGGVNQVCSQGGAIRCTAREVWIRITAKEVWIRYTDKEVWIRYTNKEVWIRYTNMLPVTSLQLCPNFCYPMDHNLQVSLYMRVLQARILGWVAMPSSRGSSWPRDWTYASCLSHWHTGSLPLVPPGKTIQT